MRTATLCLTLALLISCTGSCGGAQAGRVNWPAVIRCGDAVRDDLLPTVQAVLVQPDPEGGDTSSIGDHAVSTLEQLAVKHGPDLIACLVDQAVQSFTSASIQTPRGLSPASSPPSSGTSKRTLTVAPPAASPPVESLPEQPPIEQLAAARGRDFLTRVARTQVAERP